MNPTFPVLTTDFFLAALPILILVCGSILAMLQSVFESTRGPVKVAGLLYLCLVGALAAVFVSPEEGVYFGGAYLSGAMASFGQGFLLFVATVVAMLFRETYLSYRFFRGEITAIYMMTFAGMLTMISSDDVVTLFIGLELSALGIYSLAGYLNPTRKSQEGAIKYFVLGSFAAAILLFGFGLLYAATGSLTLTGIIAELPDAANHFWTYLGGLFVITGLGFKLALVPFHLWAPDAYEGAPTGITAIMATCVKIMILIVAMRLLGAGLDPMAAEWMPMLAFIAILSMVVGNVMAMVQVNIKRMLAYSSVAHSGYMAIALCAMAGQSNLPYQAVLFYLIGYTLTSLVAFGIIMWLENQKVESITIGDLSGLAKSHPWASFGLAVAMFSFAGMPPTVGFLGKFFVFNAAVEMQLYSLMVIGAIGSTISLFYYLRVVVKMYMTERPESAPVFAPDRSWLISGIVGLSVVAAVALGTVLPAPVMSQLKVASSPLSQK